MDRCTLKLLDLDDTWWCWNGSHGHDIIALVQVRGCVICEGIDIVDRFIQRILLLMGFKSCEACCVVGLCWRNRRQSMVLRHRIAR